MSCHQCHVGRVSIVDIPICVLKSIEKIILGLHSGHVNSIVDDENDLFYTMLYFSCCAAVLVLVTEM